MPYLHCFGLLLDASGIEDARYTPEDLLGLEMNLIPIVTLLTRWIEIASTAPGALHLSRSILLEFRVYRSLILHVGQLHHQLPSHATLHS
jgi:hypothetical protein